MPSSPESSQSPTLTEMPEREPSQKGLLTFFLLLIGIVLLNMAVGLLVVPLASQRWADLLVTILAVALPIFALFAGANARWSWKRGLIFIALGVLIQFAGHVIGERIRQPLIAGLILSGAQTGLIVWCLGLGGFLASLLRDKNLLLPLSIFLALFDMWLVFVPEGPVGKIARSVGPQQQILARVAYVVPKVQQVATGGRVEAHAYIGPADFVFMAMFFVALYRFHMRPRQTLIAIVPTLIAYLMVVLFLGSVRFGPITLQAMPALLPIGAVVLAVNWREFKLSRDELQSTVVVAVLGIALVSWRMWLHWNDYSAPKAGRHRILYAPRPLEPQGSPRPGGPNPPPSAGPPAPRGTQGPP